MPCQRRGNQSRGTIIVLPSTKSTARASLLTLTAWARASRVSTAKELIPPLEYSLAMLINELCNCIQFAAAETSGPLKSNRLQPELRDHILAPDVNVRRLASVQGHEEKTVATYSENGRHFMAILSRRLRLAPVEGEYPAQIGPSKHRGFSTPRLRELEGSPSPPTSAPAPRAAGSAFRRFVSPLGASSRAAPAGPLGGSA